MKSPYRKLLHTLRVPIDRHLAFRKLQEFHGEERSLDDIVDQALDFGGHGFFRVTSTQKRSEIRALTERVAALDPANILEIGTFRGGTAFIWAQLASRRVVTCDINDFRHQRSFYERFAPPDSTCDVRVATGNSHDPDFASSVEALFEGESIDFLFIDGDHTEVGVRQDYELYRRMVRPGGLIAFHDIVESQPLPENQVYQFWNTLRPTINFEEFVDHQNQCGYGIGIEKIAG
jgi:predicted O-methyltransferase YrrM